MHDALLVIVRDGVVLSRAIVPKDEGSRAPREAELEFRRANLLVEEIEKHPAFDFALDARREV